MPQIFDLLDCQLGQLVHGIRESLGGHHNTKHALLDIAVHAELLHQRRRQRIVACELVVNNS